MAKSYPCPHCGHRTITLWRRLSLGPARPAVCSDCGSGVGVPWSSLWLIPLAVIVPRMAIVVIPGSDGSLWAHLAAAAVSLVVFLTMWFRFAPLVKQ